MAGMSKFRLRIYHDHFTEEVEALLPAERRVIYCVAGCAEISDTAKTETIGSDGAWFSSQKTNVRGKDEGACLWRWELVTPNAPSGEIKGAGIKSRIAGDYEVEIDTSVKRLMRLDRVSFPLGGEALTHTHAAAGVRCQLEGNLLLESLGHRYRVWPGDPWVEHGPDSVYAKASEHQLSSFVRVMIVPEQYKGRSTITYVKAEDQEKPKSQNYKRYLEEPISL
jgi:hypothetical protein